MRLDFLSRLCTATSQCTRSLTFKESPEQQIHETTDIHIKALGHRRLDNLTVAERVARAEMPSNMSTGE